MSQDDAVWAETTDGGLLKQLFGYYPTLHDAVIRSIEIDRSGEGVDMVVDYCDMIGDDHTNNLKVRIRLEWRGVESLELPLYAEDIYSLDFGRDGKLIVTNFVMCGGFFGKVVSETMEAVLVQVDPGEDDRAHWLRYK